MTERVLPAVAVRAPGLMGPGVPARRAAPDLAGGPGRLPAPEGGTRPSRVAAPATGARAGARPAVHRSEAWLSMPARAGMLFGVSAAVYAVSLAGMSWLQASSDAALAAQHQPYQDAVDRARAANDALAAQLGSAAARAQSLADAYQATGNDVAAFQANLDSLASMVADVQGSAAALPSRISLPKVTVKSFPVTHAAAPKTTTKTSASGH